ncbi:MAG TPA: alpha/beta hydrolase [Acidimicrobiia bacterium]|nr:alpha/beta hydrolase [Acidimicrobiia bacterium]
MSLQPPPKAPAAPTRVAARLVGLILLMAVAGTVIWAVVTNQRIDLIEVTAIEELDRTVVDTSYGTALSVVQQGEGATQVILLHDADVAGGILWDAVVADLGADVTAVRIDLPGFGLSDRVPEEGSQHTVAVMAEMVAELAEARFDGPVVFAGVGLGGEVAAEIGVTYPDLVVGLVLVDVDFNESGDWVEFMEKLPFFGPPVTFSFEGAGRFSAGRWAPNCGDGGWCPTPDQVSARDRAETVQNTTESIRSYRKTPAASVVPSKLNEITAPTYFIWSEEGDVPQESVDLVVEALPDMEVKAVPVWKAHLEAPDVVANAILTVGS